MADDSRIDMEPLCEECCDGKHQRCPERCCCCRARRQAESQRPTDPLRALLADESHAVEFTAKALFAATGTYGGDWDRAEEWHDYWLIVARRFVPAMAALREVAGL